MELVELLRLVRDVVEPLVEISDSRQDPDQDLERLVDDVRVVLDKGLLIGRGI